MSASKDQMAQVLDVKAYDYGRGNRDRSHWSTWTSVQDIDAAKANKGVIAELKTQGLGDV